MTFQRVIVAAKYCSSISIMLVALPVFADGGHCRIKWEKLNLNPQQSQQVQQIEEQWQHTYSELAPAIADEQQLLTKKLGQHCDQLEIISLHNSIDRKQQQLRQAAMVTLLKKKAVLNDDQRRNFEDLLHAEMAKRHEENNPGEIRDITGPIQDLWNRANNVFRVNNDH